MKIIDRLRHKLCAPRCVLCGAVACADDRPYCPECLIWSFDAVGAPTTDFDEFDEETPS